MSLTIRQLKKFLEPIKDKDKNGEDYEIWIQTGDGVSSPCTAIHRLNVREGGHDVLLVPSNYDSK